MYRRSAVFVVLLLLVSASPLRAQRVIHNERTQSLSFSPILALFEIVQAEYERTIARDWTGVLGLGYWAFGDEADGGEVSWLAADLKARFYPGAQPLQGFSIGGILGLTRVGYQNDVTLEDESDTGLTFGVDLNWSWLLGHNDRWYVGLGIGAKRYVFDVEDDDVPVVLPTGRFGFGVAF